LGCGHAIETLENAMQARPGLGRRHGQPVAVVVRPSLRADLTPGNGGSVVRSGPTLAMRYAYRQ